MRQWTEWKLLAFTKAESRYFILLIFNLQILRSVFKENCHWPSETAQKVCIDEKNLFTLKKRRELSIRKYSEKYFFHIQRLWIKKKKSKIYTNFYKLRYSLKTSMFILYTLVSCNSFTNKDRLINKCKYMVVIKYYVHVLFF